MKIMPPLPSLFILLIGCLLLGGCAQPNSPTLPEADSRVNSTLWVQTSAEYRAVAMQVYRAAAAMLPELLENPAVTAALEQTSLYRDLPPAVILDIDETVLDNINYTVERLRQQKQWDSESWDNWLKSAKASAVPGAVEFLGTAESLGVEIFFVTNRTCTVRPGSDHPCPQKTDTLANLAKVGITDIAPSRVLMKGEQKNWSSDKGSRRSFLARQYRIIMLVGDDLGDFLSNVRHDLSSEQRNQHAMTNKDRWGTTWFILPNPIYGSWLRIPE